jgi:hypothetical protein
MAERALPTVLADVETVMDWNLVKKMTLGDYEAPAPFFSSHVVIAVSCHKR